MKKRSFEKKQDRKWLLVLAVVLSAVFLAALTYLLFFGFNRFSLEMELLGEKQLTLEYGEQYQEPGCMILLRGSKFWKSGLNLNSQIRISGSVNEQKLGKYVLNYHAECFGLEAESSRIVRVVDTVCPEIILVPDRADLKPEPEYREAGFAAYDNYDGDITSRVVRTEEEGKILYTVVDSFGNPAYVQRDIPIYDQSPPELTLIGGERVVLPLGVKFHDPGYIAYDRMDGDLTAQVSVSFDHPFVRYLPDSYHLTYYVTDSEGRQAVATRTLVTEPSPRPCIIRPKGKTIYLTFDDGPCPNTARLLDVLKQYNVKATFFVVDTGYPELMRRIVEEGHSIGVHTCSHRYGEIYSGADAFFEDVFAMQQRILDATGVETWLLRFPGGSSNTISRKNHGLMTYLTQAVENCGFSYFDWNVDSDDAGNAKTADAIFRNVIDGVQENPCAVVLQHDIHSCSVDAVEQIIRWGQRNGYRFLPLDIDSPPVHHAVRN